MNVFFSLLLVGFLTLGSAAKLDVLYEWEYIDYLWKDNNHKQEAIASGAYNYKKPVIIDVDKAKDGRIFATVIGGEGVPASLTTISNIKGDGGPLLAPYPNWAWAEKGNCDAITSVYRVTIDRCDRLWVLDTGRIGEEQVCPPQLLAFDLITDKLIERVKIPLNVSQNAQTKKGLLVTPIVETRGSRCWETYVYMADVDGYGLVIYDGRKIWRLESKVFEPKPNAVNFTIAGESFNLPDGILGMALSHRVGFESSRRLYFRSLASYDMYMVSTDELKRSGNGSPVHYYGAANMLPSQSAAQDFTTDGTLFFGLTTQTSLACWNRFRPAKPQFVVQTVRNPKILQFASGVKVISSGRRGTGEDVWLVTNRFQKIMAGSQNFSDVNFRILRGSVRELVANTVCQPPWHDRIDLEDRLRGRHKY